MANADSRPTPAAPFLSFTPLLGKTPTQIAERLRAFGAHPPHAGARERTAALTLRADVTVGDALESLSAALDQVRGVLAMLEVDDTIPEYARHAISGALVQAQLAGAHHCVVDVAIREHQPDEDLAAGRIKWVKAARDLAAEVACDLDSAAQLLGHCTAQSESAVEASIGARAVIEAAGAKLDALAGQQVRDRPIDWLLSPLSRKAMGAIEEHAGV